MQRIIFGLLTTISSVSISYAQLNVEEALKLQKLAEDNEKRARELEIEAKEARKEAERFRYLMVAEEIAIRSTKISDKELAALLALQAYNFNIKYKGYSRSSDIYFGLSNALKRYDKLPARLDNSAQIIDDYGKKKMTIDDLKGSELLRKILKRQIWEIERIEFSHSGKLMATVSKDMGIRIWNLENIRGQPMLIIENDSIENLMFNADDSQIVCRLIDSSKGSPIVHVWPLEMDKMASQLCSLLSHNMTKEDWDEYIGDGNYAATCKDIPPRK